MLTLLIQLLLTNSWAINPTEGGGGNICVSWRSGRTVVLDELNELTSNPRFFHWKGEIISASLNSDGTANQTDLTKLKAMKRMLGSIDENFSGETTHVMHRMAKTFSSVFVTERTATQPLETDERVVERCFPGTIRPIMITYLGLYAISLTDWNRLDSATQNILLTHEVLRGLQSLVGNDVMTNRNLSSLTNYIQGTRFPLGENLFQKMFAARFKKIRAEHPRRKFEVSMSRLKQQLENAIKKEDIAGSYLLMRDILLLDLAYSRGRRDVPLFRSENYNKLVEKRFITRMNEIFHH